MGGPIEKIPVTEGQLRYEVGLLSDKLRGRDPRRCEELVSIKETEPHPMFEVVQGAIEGWEKATASVR